MTFLQAGRAKRHRMIAHFDADVTSSHFMRDGGSGAGTEEAI